MKTKFHILFLLMGLCFISSCAKKSNTERIANMKNCEKIEFFYGDSGEVYTEITNPDKVQKIISAMQQLEKYNSGALFFIHMRAINKNGRKVESGLVWRDRRQIVIFKDGRSKKLYSILKEEGIITDPKPPASPDFGMKYVELTEDTFQNLKVSEILSVDISIQAGKESDELSLEYRKVFPIKDTGRIQIVYDCINNAVKLNPWSTDYNNEKLVFTTTKETLYFLTIESTNELVFSNWWKSIELAEYFKEWGMKLPK